MDMAPMYGKIHGIITEVVREDVDGFWHIKDSLISNSFNISVSIDRK
jgi:hypothetical protein